MNARKFIAASSRDALKLVRAELGDDAVILSNRKVAEGVEIVAVDGCELEHLSETRVSRKAPTEQRETRRTSSSENNETAAVTPPNFGKLSAQGAHQAATLGASSALKNCGFTSERSSAIPAARKS